MRPPRPAAAGEELPGRTIGPISRIDIARFAGAGGDFNPLHHDPEAARSAGFDDVIAMGQLHAGLLAGWVSDTFGVEHLLEYGVRFAAPVRVGDTLALSGTVAAIEGTTGRLELAARCGDTIVLTAHADVTVARP